MNAGIPPENREDATVLMPLFRLNGADEGAQATWGESQSLSAPMRWCPIFCGYSKWKGGDDTPGPHLPSPTPYL